MKSATVLVVDDDPFVRDLVTETLSLQQFSVSSVANGQEALDAIATRAPDVVLLDVRLGGDPDGLEVCRRICSQSGAPAVIFLTGAADNKDRDAGFAAGASGYLTKPFSPLELIERINSTLGR